MSAENDQEEDSVVTRALAGLPKLAAHQIPSLDDSCPICLLPFRDIFENAKSSAQENFNQGVTKIAACGHIFCVEDLSEWIRGRHGTCPACRHEFLPELRPVDSDVESSDGGEYVPTEYDADSDFDTDYDEGSDGIDLETMDVDAEPSDDVAPWTNSDEVEVASVYRSDSEWWDVDGEQEWGLTDGDSMSASEGELSPGERSSGPEADIQIRVNSEGEYSLEEDTVGEAPKP
ncbi:hypothetical protein BV25DRAFT_1817662 [Artomyces pyxidatus]|uniref:Uncharacterized protein n=1 Tax=Artomyces pyxidatus TaxID=48021 RepID=A0ACB8TJV8_9AGAM|nr:hypothetical protein BV25DRAFT_1817662 [Artomyces pyxidatus]